MEKYVHIASTSMRLQIDNQRIIAQALANQNTVAFKSDYGSVSSTYFDQEGGTDRVFPSRGAAAIDQESGKIVATDNPLDVSIDGEGFFVGTSPNGETVITRRGDFRMGADRVLRNGENITMQGDSGPIQIPLAETVEVSKDGTVQIRPPGAETNSEPTSIGRLQLIKTPPGNVVKGDDGLMRLRDKSVPQADASVALNTKGLESSNVNSIDAMVDMLNASRTFEIHVKLLATAKELDDQTAKLMRSNA